MPALPELASTKLPVGTSTAITRAAYRHGVSPSEYMRAALHRQLTADHECPTILDVCAPRLRQLTPPARSRTSHGPETA